MSNDFFKKFTEDTNVKLELYEDYLTEWLPVFISSPKPYLTSVNILDLFCGPGKDEEGTLGSPLLALKVLKKYEEFVFNLDMPVNLYFNDKSKDYIDELKINVDEYGYNKGKINIHYSCTDFEDFYPSINAITQNSANLMFLDQFGVKYVDRPKFIELVQLPRTDLIFFISSTTFKRFHTDENITNILGIDSSQIQTSEFYKIHKLVHEAYIDMIPENHSYGLAPFSIKKGSNVYGLIFGSGHPLGMEKFLDICWLKDEITGEANFDILGDIKLTSQPSLFAKEDASRTKISVFQTKLEEAILSKELNSDMDIYYYTINRGFTNKHIKPVIKELKDSKRIALKHPSFKCQTVTKKGRTPKTIEILK